MIYHPRYVAHQFSGENMTKKEEFVKAFQKATGKHPKEFHEKKDHKGFVEITDKNPSLGKLFNEAVAEAEESKNDPAAGLSGLFEGI